MPLPLHLGFSVGDDEHARHHVLDCQDTIHTGSCPSHLSVTLVLRPYNISHPAYTPCLQISAYAEETDIQLRLVRPREPHIHEKKMYKILLEGPQLPQFEQVLQQFTAIFHSPPSINSTQQTLNLLRCSPAPSSPSPPCSPSHSLRPPRPLPA